MRLRRGTDGVKKRTAGSADLIAFYGIQPSELAELSDEARLGLSLNMPRIRARQRLEFCLDIRESMPSDGKGVSQNLMNLVLEAYPDDDAARAVLIESLTRA